MTALLTGFIRAVGALMSGVRALIAAILVMSVLLNFANVIVRKFVSRADRRCGRSDEFPDGRGRVLGRGRRRVR